MLKKSTFREIKSSIERYLAILSIVALGVGFFAGLKITKSDMLSTAENYLDDCVLYDYRLASSFGIDADSIKIAQTYEDVEIAEASKEVDVLTEGGKDGDKVFKAISMPEKMNIPQLKEGRMPKTSDECVVDSASAYKLGDTLELSSDNETEDLENFKIRKYKVVGRVTSPLFMDYQRGSGKLGNGSLNGFFYIMDEAFELEYDTQLYVKLKSVEEYFGDSVEKDVEAREKSMEKLSKEINKGRRAAVVAEAQKTLDEKKADYESGLSEYNSEKASAEAKLASAESKIAQNEANLKNQRTDLNKKKSDLSSQKTELSANLSQVSERISFLESLGDALSDEQRALLQQLKVTEAQITAGISQIDAGLTQIDAGLREISSYERELESARFELASNRRKADAEFADAKAELDDGKNELDKAQKKIDDIENGSSYTFSRYDNSGFASFEENASIIDGIAKVFPLFFFLVAAQVCMTTMSRMIEDQRTQIGILKALGYSNAKVLGKYLFYSGSAAAIGAIAGFFIGCRIFPKVIWNAYGMMYNFNSHLVYNFSWPLAIISFAVALLCSMGATWFSCSADFKVAPADLIRPKSPPAGKRILLERIGPLWKRISFLYKVSIRNTFRFKKRFFMMVLGISGCTALLIAGFGIDTTIKNIAKQQYGEIITYDYMIAFDDDMSESDQKSFSDFADETIGKDKADMLFVHQSNATVKLKGKSKDVVVVASDDKSIEDYIKLHDGSKRIEYPGEDEVVLPKETHERYGVNVGDTVTIRDGYRSCKLKVTALCDNYVGRYAFMSASTYETGMGEKPEIKTVLVNAKGNSDVDAMRDDAMALARHDRALASVVNQDTIDRVDIMMGSLNAVVVVVILCAGLLAFIVLYNLTNINISERIREVATIKVLGFYDKETQQYVFRENFILTGIAALVGIPLGKWLLDFVISKITVEMVFFVPRITTVGYLMAVAMTFVFALIVNIAMTKRLKNISMTESLKSIE